MKYLKNVALALVAFVFVACGSSQSPSEVAEKFLQKVYDDKIEMSPEEYKNSLSSKSEEVVKSDLKVKDILKSIKEYTKNQGGLKEVVVNKEQIDDDEAILLGKELNDDEAIFAANIFYNNEEVYKIYVFLIKENKEWKVLNFGR